MTLNHHFWRFLAETIALFFLEHGKKNTSTMFFLTEYFPMGLPDVFSESNMTKRDFWMMNSTMTGWKLGSDVQKYFKNSLGNLGINFWY